MKTQYDVVVMGSGAAGMAAALTVAEGGASVAVCEKNKYCGGISNLGAELFAVESELERQNNYPLTRDDAFRIFMDRTHWQADARLVRAFIDKSASTIKWLEKLGLEFELQAHFAYPDSFLTGHFVKTPGAFGTMMKRMRAAAEEEGAEILTETPVKRISKHGEAIAGVLVEDESGVATEIRAGAVVIASGGYPNNAQLLKNHGGFELGKDLYLLPKVELRGDGILMAWELGAASDGMGLALRYDPPAHAGVIWKTMHLSVLTQQPYLWVNTDGERFFDESICSCNAYAANALARQKDRCAFLMFDENTRRYMEEVGFDNVFGGLREFTKATGLDELFAEYKGQTEQNTFINESAEQIAIDMGIPVDRLSRTIKEYNGFCDKGHDDWFAKDRRYLQPVREPRFYAVRIRNTAYGTVGGIKINHKTEVVDTQGEPIRGLYAAGDCANGATSYDFSLAFRLRGNPCSFALNTGRIAGENVLAYISNVV